MVVWWCGGVVEWWSGDVLWWEEEGAKAAWLDALRGCANSWPIPTGVGLQCATRWYSHAGISCASVFPLSIIQSFTQELLVKTERPPVSTTSTIRKVMS